MPAPDPKHVPRPDGRPRRPGDAEYQRIVRAHALDLQRLTASLASGDLTPDQWADAFHSVLVEGHGDAYALGRQRAGDLAAKSAEDALRGLDSADAQNEFLQGFLADLKGKDPRYFDDEGALREAAVNVRARQYCSAMRATANEAFVDAGEPDDEYDWELGASEGGHCTDCPELAALGPYTASTMISHPGDGQTDCSVHCTCRLVRRRGGLAGFSRADLFGEALPATSPALKAALVRHAFAA